ncbi:MAG TPA: Clp1/GlmU family protein [Thermodesulfovibrionales bacterium]|nr:Clp1/GlmU family protein [Thermodesulfovibrionales bacterium]
MSRLGGEDENSIDDGAMAGTLEDFIRDKAVLRELTESANKIIMILGGSDSGKTTLIEHLAHSLAKDSTVGIVDLDMGQSHIGPPTTVAWGKVRGGFEGWSGVMTEDFYFTGTVTPLGSLLPAVTGAKLMTDKAASSCDKVIIDTTGLIAEPAGRLLKQHKADIICPDIILAVDRSGELDHILDPFLLQRRPRVCRLPVPDFIGAKSPSQRGCYRFEKIAAYFHGADVIEVRTADIPLRMTGGPLRGDITRMRNRIVSFRNEHNRDISLGFIEGIDADRETLQVLTPLKHGTRFTAVIVGKTEIDMTDGELRDASPVPC